MKCKAEALLFEFLKEAIGGKCLHKKPHCLLLNTKHHQALLRAKASSLGEGSLNQYILKRFSIFQKFCENFNKCLSYLIALLSIRMVWVAVVGPARGSCTKKERTCKACYKPFEMSSFSLLYHFQVHLKVTIDAPAWSQQMEGTQTSLLSHLYTPTTLFPHSDPLGCKKNYSKKS